MKVELTADEVKYLLFILRNDAETLADDVWIDDGDRYLVDKLLKKLGGGA